MSIVKVGAQDLARGFNAFGLRLYGELGKGGNSFFSPLSISMAISALVPGARGATRDEIEGALGLHELSGPVQECVSALLQSLLNRKITEWEWSDASEESQEVERDIFTLNIATALFVQETYPILASYRDTVTDHFGAELFSLDFKAATEAVGHINGWVSEHTQGKIRTLVSSDALDPLTRLVLANAVYFKAAWSYPFEVANTLPEPFFLLSESGGADTVEVRMMRQQLDLLYWSDKVLGVEAVSIPYEGISMVVLLPGKGQLAALRDALDVTFLDRVLAGFESTLVELKLPRFEVRCTYQLGEALRELGIEVCFDTIRSDFSGVTDHPEGLSIFDVMHNAWVRVDEEGTEAAAATSMALGAGVDSSEEPPIPFHVDRPFVFLIRDDETGTVLFMGQIMDPTVVAD
ncbi:MAG: serpin family protein [Gammaproteobacteria bacterium]|nr:serpin family protein [Gammaproteobacteria bacterium]